MCEKGEIIILQKSHLANSAQTFPIKVFQRAAASPKGPQLVKLIKLVPGSNTCTAVQCLPGCVLTPQLVLRLRVVERSRGVEIDGSGSFAYVHISKYCSLLVFFFWIQNTVHQ